MSADTACAGGGTGRRAGWFVKSEGPAAVDEEWTPLWKYDSDIVEEKYQRGDINSGDAFCIAAGDTVRI